MQTILDPFLLPLLKILDLDIKLLHSAQEDDAASLPSGHLVMYSHMYSKFSAFSYFVPIYLTILNCILSKPLCQYHSGRGAAVQNEKHHIHSTYFTFFD